MSSAKTPSSLADRGTRLCPASSATGSAGQRGPLGIVTAQLFDKLEFGGESPLTMRARCSAFRYCPNPLGIVTAQLFDKLEFI